jgi:hypothetical protein
MMGNQTIVPARTSLKVIQDSPVQLLCQPRYPSDPCRAFNTGAQPQLQRRQRRRLHLHHFIMLLTDAAKFVNGQIVEATSTDGTKFEERGGQRLARATSLSQTGFISG